MANRMIPREIRVRLEPNTPNQSIEVITEVFTGDDRFTGKFEISMREANRPEVLNIVERQTSKVVKEIFAQAFYGGWPSSGTINMEIDTDAAETIRELERVRFDMEKQAAIRAEAERRAEEARRRSPVASSRRGGKTTSWIVDLVRAFKETKISLDQFQAAVAEVGLSVPDAVRTYFRETGESPITGEPARRSRSQKSIEKRGRIERSNRAQNQLFKTKKEEPENGTPEKEERVAGKRDIEFNDGNITVDEGEK